MIGSQPKGELDAAAYLALGARQSIFPAEQRAAVHQLFRRYQAWLADSDLIAQRWQALAEPTYGFYVNYLMRNIKHFPAGAQALAAPAQR
ncbi:hypothetical protein [Azotobacter salinestris]|uniref:hypothetical protein n=1 Tax=Azotobacter salinestris TaxID=69964 RepID=UPI0032DF31E6